MMKWHGDKILDMVDEASEQATTEVADIIFEASQDAVPVKTGALKKSGFVDTDGSQAVIGYDKEYASIVHETKTKFLEDAIKEKFAIIQTKIAQIFKGGLK